MSERRTKDWWAIPHAKPHAKIGYDTVLFYGTAEEADAMRNKINSPWGLERSEIGVASITVMGRTYKTL